MVGRIGRRIGGGGPGRGLWLSLVFLRLVDSSSYSIGALWSMALDTDDTYPGLFQLMASLYHHAT
ncbi:Uncharacterized protein APZ42_025166 [Daphnia magna]|uniref:Uncharacterized protein n=1 Tax=Daphnia magna TaxID=35525 RepID=A0A164TE01_9CRUS|nr:Uncharacterized protein APZ42_025166 [Daphnia magna]